MDTTKSGPAWAEPFSCLQTKLAKSGTLIALSYCNLHGLWESSQEIKVD